MKTLLRTYRRRHKLSQAQLAERLGVPVRTLQNWEIGRNEPGRLARMALMERMKR